MTQLTQTPTRPISKDASTREIGAPERVIVRSNEELKQKLQEGLDAIERGDVLPAEDVFAELRQRAESYRQ